MDETQIRQVRSFNRLVTQRVGALEESYLQRGRPLSEARLLFEAGRAEEPAGIDVRALRQRLELDSGYLSRLLRSLEGQGLVEVRRRADDARVRTVTLTKAGRAERDTYEALSDQLADAILAPLDAPRRERLVAAMAEVERLLARAALDVRPEDPDTADARGCLEAYVRELAERFEAGFDPARSNPIAAADMRPPRGCLVLARMAGRPVGCGALKGRLDGSGAHGGGAAAIGEIKRMWVDPSARGLGVARRILEALEALAREAGFTTLRLETNGTLVEAQALYRSAGYGEVAPFNGEPYAHHWFEKAL